jgi:hypothetical protein
MGRLMLLLGANYNNFSQRLKGFTKKERIKSSLDSRILEIVYLDSSE